MPDNPYLGIHAERAAAQRRLKLKSGADVPGARITQTERLEIK